MFAKCTRLGIDERVKSGFLKYQKQTQTQIDSIVWFRTSRYWSVTVFDACQILISFSTNCKPARHPKTHLSLNKTILNNF